MRRAKQLDCNCVTSPTVNETPPSRTKRTPHGRNQFNLSMRITGVDECYWSQAREPLREISGSSNFPQTLNSPHKLITKFQQAPFHWSSTSTDCFPFRGPMLQFPLPPLFFWFSQPVAHDDLSMDAPPTFILNVQPSTIEPFITIIRSLRGVPCVMKPKPRGSRHLIPPIYPFASPSSSGTSFVIFHSNCKRPKTPLYLFSYSVFLTVFPHFPVSVCPSLPLPPWNRLEMLLCAQRLQFNWDSQINWQPQSDGMLNMIANRLLQTILTNQPWIS